MYHQQSKGSKGSRRSRLSEAILRKTTKWASLLAEASIVAKHQNIANEGMRLKLEEMRLLQQKQGVTLETEIAKVEAEEKVCAEFMSNEGYSHRDRNQIARNLIENETLRKPNERNFLLQRRSLAIVR